jgi:hypothetical protein
MPAKVRGLERLGGFRLRIEFNDGSKGVHDFSAMVREPGPMLVPLREEAYFARVFLEFGALTWPNGFDIALEWLRREMSAAGELEQTASAERPEASQLLESLKICGFVQLSIEKTGFKFTLPYK